MSKPTKKEKQEAKNDKLLDQWLAAIKAVEAFKAKQKQ